MHRCQPLFVGVLALILGVAPAFAAPKAASAVPGPLGKDTGRVRGEGVLTIKIIPDSAEEPVVTLGHPIRVELTAAAIPSRIPGHPFEVFVAITAPTAAGGMTQDELFARCGTIHAEGSPAIPGTAISLNQPKPLKGKGEGRATYAVAETDKVAVGLLEIPKMLTASGIDTEGQLQLAATTFSVALEKGGSLRFYASSPSKQETLAVMVEVSEWKYVAAPTP